MSIECDDLDLGSELSDYLDWACKIKLWNGRKVSWMEASEFQEEVQTRLYKLLFERLDSSIFEQLAYIGTSRDNHFLLAREIEELNFSQNPLVLQAGFQKSCSKFWKKHRKEILIGAAIVAAVTVVIVVSVSTAGAGTAATAGGAALGKACDQEKKKGDNLKPPTPPESLEIDLSSRELQLSFEESGVVFQGQYTPYEKILFNDKLPYSIPTERLSEQFSQQNPLSSSQIQPECLTPCNPIESFSPNDFLDMHRLQSQTPPKSDCSDSKKQKNWLCNFLDTIGQGIIDNPELLDPNEPLPSYQPSFQFLTLGKNEVYLGLEGINGINTTLEDATAHAKHLEKFAQNHAINWTYNKSHGAVIDVMEAAVLNIPGYSPNTSDLLLMSWRAFAQANADNPDIKFLQYCHSQGTIHVRNALKKAPPEIRDRIIIQAFGPAVIISDDLCFRADHYACKGDLIPHAEVAHAELLGGLWQGSKALENQKKLLWVEPHPDMKSPHDFQNPAFDDIKERTIREHINRKGVYK